LGGFQGVNLRFAVTTPRSVELDEDILGVVLHDLIVVMRNNNVNRSFLLLGNRFRLDAGFHLPVNESLDEFIDFTKGNLLALIIGKFLILDRLLDGESREPVSLEVKVGSVGTKGLGINGGEIDLALMLDGNGFELFSKGRTLFRGLCEDIRQGNTGLFTSQHNSPARCVEHCQCKYSLQCSRSRYQGQLRPPKEQKRILRMSQWLLR
jgi:hypothetical protein